MAFVVNTLFIKKNFYNYLWCFLPVAMLYGTKHCQFINKTAKLLPVYEKPEKLHKKLTPASVTYGVVPLSYEYKIY
ncbi:hypothetical protein RG47T_3362 [Mucilaginibacter polytrichastri]|uniref:Uncharacterized protein n=1 Tax=Mucilaginibacter polytrichastri TaxID=1302689 RepID=A0A1Q6A1K1_9SPHI|nr:hypothetical protein RG47T_3362 [Mucilaginibacter polytrichastri]